MRRTTAVPLLFVLLSGGVARAEAPSLNEVRDRGVHYHHKGLHEAAIAELDKARAMPGGDEDFQTHFILAKASYELLRLERTFPAAQAAAELAESDRETARSEALLKELRAFYGGVKLTKAPEARTDQGYVYLEDTGGLINKRKKEVFGTLRERYRNEASLLPVTIYLPFGKYTANRVPFETQKDEVAEILIIPDAEAADGGLGALWWVVGGTAAVVAAGAVALVLLSGDDDPSTSLRLSGGSGL